MARVTRFVAVSLGLAFAGGVFLLVEPTYTLSDGFSTKRATLLQINGSWALVPVLFPLVVGFLPVLFRMQTARIASAVLLCAFSLVAGPSIGLFYAPAAILMLSAACVKSPTPTNDRSR